MIYSANLLDMCNSISNIDVPKYLTDCGWQRIVTKNKVFKIFQFHSEEKLFQVKIPLEKDFVDYSQLMFDVAEKVALVENKTIEQVILELINPMSDIVRVRINNDSVKNGSIYFEDAISLYENTRKLITATALDLMKKEIYHSGRPIDNVQKFIQKCRFGQTEIGSYITNVVCPFVDEEQNEQLSIFTPEDISAHSLTRRVTNKLLQAVELVKSTIDADKDLEKIVKTDSDEHISINFLEALQSLNIDKENSEFDLGIKWAPTIKQNRVNIKDVQLNHFYYSPIKAITNKYKLVPDLERKKYIGKVQVLKGNEDLTKRKSGLIHIVCIDDDTKRKVYKAKLNCDDYLLAVKAHVEGDTVSVEGVLDKEKKDLITDCTISIL